MIKLLESVTTESTSRLTSSRNHPIAGDIVFDVGRKQILCASLTALVEEITPHDSDGHVDPTFFVEFLLTFRLFSSPMEVLEKLLCQWNFPPPSDLPVRSPVLLKVSLSFVLSNDISESMIIFRNYRIQNVSRGELSPYYCTHPAYSGILVLLFPEDKPR